MEKEVENKGDETERKKEEEDEEEKNLAVGIEL